MTMFKQSVVLAAVILTGCSTLTRTDYHVPAVSLPETFKNVTGDVGVTPLDAWWRRLEEPHLDAWVDLARARNADLAAAAIRVKRATLESRLAGNALLPAFNGTVATSVSRPLSGDTQGSTKTTTGTLGVTWQIDLFDRLGAQRDAAAFEAKATAEDRDAVALSLVGTTVKLYWQLAFANQQIALAKQNVADAARIHDLVLSQYAVGAVSGLERREAEQAVAEQKLALSQLVQAKAELQQSLMVLFDGAVPPSPAPEHLPMRPLPSVQAGLPAELLLRRPDLRAAELRLRRVLASSDAVQARYYPALSLTGSLGTSSTALLNVLAHPVATLGAGLTLPFLNVRDMRINKAIARTRYEEAIVIFRKSLYNAFADVEKALSARTQLAQQEAAQWRMFNEAIEIERIYEARYRAGQVALRIWLDAKKRRRSAEVALATTCLAQLQNHVTLIQALGGGMETQGRRAE
ncbi:Outer membrane protein OprM precursor [Marinomonas spartinae]|uniref:Outer membrane protein OprM n=2 Tax=Marinomonas spartinae TaxID=1792290 RepID=A0A1A8TR84_9GAMM|nr:Outer membrane protein OprM precursor [Marinomonas spartinae]